MIDEQPGADVESNNAGTDIPEASGDGERAMSFATGLALIVLFMNLVSCAWIGVTLWALEPGHSMALVPKTQHLPMILGCAAERLRR